MSELNIYQRVNKVMSECVYLQKKQAQQGKGIKYDEVMAMIRQLLIANGIVMVTTQESLECLGAVEGTKQKVYQGKFSLKLVNMDKPDEFIEHTAYAQGMDGGDKGAGKAHTYAMKTMLVKGFGIETGEDEESRAEKQEKLNVISADEYAQLAVYCVDPAGGSWSETGTALMGAYKLSGIQNLPASKFVEALKRAKSHASNK
tara:strand:+ start:229 stop:834 length:606 start_codon:yes stop_codon:yes gene_type:complete